MKNFIEMEKKKEEKDTSNSSRLTSQVYDQSLKGRMASFFLFGTLLGSRGTKKWGKRK